MDRRLVLGLDFNNLAFSSYFGDQLINSSGINTNAIKTFFFRIKALKDSLEPDYIVLANDLSRERTFRRKMYKAYKATRKPKDPDIITQMKAISHMCSLLGWPFINNELYEADDILGMISKYCQENNMNMIIVSSDKDLYQLVDENVYILSPKTKEIIDLHWLQNRYRLTPAQWIELKMLMGDRSDNIPGINGIGEVTALRLLQEYQSIDNIYEHLGSLKPQLRDVLTDGFDKLSLTRKLVTIITDYKLIDFKPSMLETRERYERELYQVINELEIYSLHNVMKYSLLVDKGKRDDTN